MAASAIRPAAIVLISLWTYNASAQSVVYQVNAKGQVTSATYVNGTTISYLYDASGNRLSATVTVDTTPPTAPGTPTASNITGTSATISWTAATDPKVAVTGYSYQLNGGAWSAFSNVLSVNVGGLALYTTYTVGVRAQDSAGNIGPTATGSFRTLDTVPPTAPGTPAITNITSSSATVTWTAATDSVGVTGYSYQLNGGAWSAFSNVLTVNLGGLANYTAYTVGVRAQDTAGNIGPIASANFQTLDATLPSAPGTPTASNVTSSSATVSWTAATDSVVSVTGYSYQINGGAWSAFSSGLIVNLTGLANYTVYTIGVRAQDSVGNIGPTATGSFTTLDSVLPSAPGTPTASNITSSSATISWAAATDSVVGITGYSYQVNGGAWSAFSNVLSINLTGLAASTGYSVGVRAQDAVGNIGPTATGSFTTAAPSAQATLTSGTYTIPPYVTEKGYIAGTTGSISPTTVTGSLTYQSVIDVTASTGISEGLISISGFSANPGIGWLISATVGSATKSGSTATYTFSGTTATWSWPGSVFGIGATALVTIVY